MSWVYLISSKRIWSKRHISSYKDKYIYVYEEELAPDFGIKCKNVEEVFKLLSIEEHKIKYDDVELNPLCLNCGKAEHKRLYKYKFCSKRCMEEYERKYNG